MESQKDIADLLRSAISSAVEKIATRPARIAYTIDEAAESLGLTRRKVEGLIARGELPARKVGNTLLISVEAIRKLVP